MWRLLSDAKPPKNVPKDLIARYIPGDLTDVVEGIPDIGGQKVGRDSGA